MRIQLKVVREANQGTGYGGHGENRRGDTWTVGRLVRWCEGYFREKGSKTPRLDSELLLARVLSCSRVRLYVDWGKILKKDELRELRHLVARRGRGEPLAYILGEREFWSLSFKVKPGVLIPRPETEHVVEAVLEAVSAYGLSSPVIAEMGTGSGNIACALAKSLPTGRIFATDNSRTALEVALENIRNLGLSERIQLIQADILEPLRAQARFDVIVSNPPYVKEEEWSGLPVEVREHEPKGALYGEGTNGLSVLERFLVSGKGLLKLPGVLVSEIGWDQGVSAKEIAGRAGFDKVSVNKDFSGKDRVLVAVVEERGRGSPDAGD